MVLSSSCLRSLTDLKLTVSTRSIGGSNPSEGTMRFFKRTPKVKPTLDDIKPYTIAKTGNGNFVVQLNGVDCQYDYCDYDYRTYTDIAISKDLDSAIRQALEIKSEDERKARVKEWRSREDMRIPLKI